MAKRLDDEDRRPGDEDEDLGVGRRHPEVEAAEFEAERPARELSGLPRLIISAAAVAVSLYALLWVVRPQPAQPYRTSFLAVTLAMTLLAYRPLARGRAASNREQAPEGSGEPQGVPRWIGRSPGNPEGVPRWIGVATTRGRWTGP
jgi:hypothetical protein